MSNVIELIGNTPLVEITRLDTGPCRLFVKHESQNPAGSIKDRIAGLSAVAEWHLSLGASLWANTDRKRRELSVLRLLGFRGGGIMLYPSFHALFTAVLGWLGAVFVYLVLEQIINRMLAADLAAGQSICFLMPRHFLAALFLT